MFPERQPFHVLEHKILGLQLSDDADEMQDKLVARIVQRTLSDQGKTLARRATENHINLGIDEIRAASNIVVSDVYNTATNRPCLREVVLVSGTVNWIDFDGSGNIETSLFKAQGQAAGTGEQVNPDGAMRVMA